MAYTTINKSSSFMNPKIYTGTGSSNAVTGVGFQPDLVWVKDRDAANWNCLMDAVRGVSKVIYSNSTDAEATVATLLTSFDSDGFTLGTSNDGNTNTNDYASWNWLAGTTTGIAGSPSITPASYSFNATSGFSIIKYVGTGANATLPHGLGVAPKMIIIKELDNTASWVTYHASLGNTKAVFIDTTQVPAVDSTYWQDTTPTSTLFSLGSNGNLNQSSTNYIAYCFADISGYSKFGSYTGNGNANGPFVYTGFKPAYYMTKRTDSTGDWRIRDNKRESFNPVDKPLSANSDAAENSNDNDWDIVSNGLKLRDTGTGENASGGTYIYMAFGQTLVGTNNIPATAR